MKELIKIELLNFQNEKINSVNARDLHNFLGVKKDFSSWIKIQFTRGIFDKNIDYLVFTQKGEKPIGGRPLIEYYLTLDTAKEISMMSGTSKGKEVRNYFIKVEKEFFKMQEQLNNQPNIKKTYVNLSDTKVREAFFIAFDGKCYYSKEKLSRTNFHIDHIQPKVKGGEDITSNLVLCIPEINLVKGDSYDKEFVTKHQNIISKTYAPKVEAILNLSKNSFDTKYLFNSGVIE